MSNIYIMYTKGEDNILYAGNSFANAAERLKIYNLDIAELQIWTNGIYVDTITIKLSENIKV